MPPSSFLTFVTKDRNIVIERSLVEKAFHREISPHHQDVIINNQPSTAVAALLDMCQYGSLVIPNIPFLIEVVECAVDLEATTDTLNLVDAKGSMHLQSIHPADIGIESLRCIDPYRHSLPLCWRHVIAVLGHRFAHNSTALAYYIFEEMEQAHTTELSATSINALWMAIMYTGMSRRPRFPSITHSVHQITYRKHKDIADHRFTILAPTNLPGLLKFHLSVTEGTVQLLPTQEKGLSSIPSYCKGMVCCGGQKEFVAFSPMDGVTLRIHPGYLHGEEDVACHFEFFTL